MSIAQRIQICRLLEKMEQQAEYSRKLGLEDVSVFMKEEKVKRVTDGEVKR